MNGIVADKTTKQPIPYANVVALDVNDKPTVYGTTTSEKGEFSLNTGGKIQISYVGYDTLVTGQTATNVYWLQPSETLLDEIVILGKKEVKIKWGWIALGAIALGGLIYYSNKKKK